LPVHSGRAEGDLYASKLCRTVQNCYFNCQKLSKFT